MAVLVGHPRQSAAAHLTAEAGGVYYFQVKNKWLREHGFVEMTLEPIDADQGQLLADKFRLSISQPKN